MGEWIDRISRGLNIPNSHGGPINGVIVETFNIQSDVDGLSTEGEWCEYFFGGGASVVAGLAGELKIKLEKVSSGYDLVWEITGEVNLDLMGGVKSPGVKSYIQLLGLVKVGAPVTFHFTTNYGAVKGMAIALRIALSLGATPMLPSTGPLGWIMKGVLIDRSIDDVRYMARHVVGLQIQLTAQLEVGAKAGLDVFEVDDDTEWNVLSAQIKAAGIVSLAVKGRYQNGCLALTLIIQVECEASASAKALAWGPTGNLKITVGADLLGESIYENLLTNPSYVFQWGGAKAHLPNSHLGDPQLNLGIFAGIEGSFGMGPGLPGGNKVGIELKLYAKLIELLRFMASIPDPAQDMLACLAHLGTVLNLDLKATNQEITSVGYGDEFKICGVGIALKLGWRKGTNVSGWPKSEQGLNPTQFATWVASNY